MYWTFEAFVKNMTVYQGQLTAILKHLSFPQNLISDEMGLKKIFLRYHPPGIVLEYTRQGKEHKKEIDLYGTFPTFFISAKNGCRTESR